MVIWSYYKVTAHAHWTLTAIASGGMLYILYRREGTYTREILKSVVE